PSRSLFSTHFSVLLSSFLSSFLFFFECSLAPPLLHSFPTRRSSDLHPSGCAPWPLGIRQVIDSAPAAQASWPQRRPHRAGLFPACRAQGTRCARWRQHRADVHGGTVCARSRMERDRRGHHACGTLREHASRAASRPPLHERLLLLRRDVGGDATPP